MLNKSAIALVSAGMMLSAAMPALAETGSSNTDAQARTASSTPRTGKQLTSTQIACVGTAVATREAALAAGLKTLHASIAANYAARASALASAYALTTDKEVKEGVRKAWGSFKSSQKEAQRTWKAARDSAWKAFRSSAASCRASGSIIDSGNQGQDVSGT